MRATLGRVGCAIGTISWRGRDVQSETRRDGLSYPWRRPCGIAGVEIELEKFLDLAEAFPYDEILNRKLSINDRGQGATPTKNSTPMNAVPTNPMSDLYRRLKAVGLKRSYVRKMVLPEWWDDQIADNPAGFLEGLLYLSRHAGLDLATMKDSTSSPAFRNFGTCKYKKSAGVSDDQLSLARAMATRAAQLVSLATTVPVVPLPSSPELIRREILGQGDHWIGLKNLLDYCWSAGVPVLHVSSFPDIRKPEGFAANVNGRPVIVLFKKVTQPAWLLFILAHELGHLACGHVADEGVLIDDNIKTNEQDQEEDEANAFAIGLLTGGSETKFFAPSRWPNAKELALSAREIGLQCQLDPGHVVLNYAHTMGKNFFAVANAALKLLDPGADALKLVRNQMAERIDWSMLPEASAEFLMRLSLAGPEC